MKRALVTAKAKNEGLSIIEWVAWHKLLGFDQILIITNDNEDGSDWLLDALHRAGHIDYIDVSHLPVEGSIGRRSMKALMEWPRLREFDWLLNLDLDEFLYIQEDLHLQALSGQLASNPCLFLNWMNFSSNDALEMSDDLLADSNPYARPALHGKADRNGKIFCRIEGLVDFKSEHRGVFSDGRKALQTSGLRPKKSAPVYDTAFIAHYPTKSVAHYVFRQGRGESYAASDYLNAKGKTEHNRQKYNFLHFVTQGSSEGCEQMQLLNETQRQKLLDTMTQLRADRAVAEAEQEVRAYYNAPAQRERVAQSFLYHYIKGGIHLKPDEDQLAWGLQRYGGGPRSHDLFLLLAHTSWRLGKHEDALHYCRWGQTAFESDPLRKIQEAVQEGRQATGLDTKKLARFK